MNHNLAEEASVADVVVSRFPNHLSYSYARYVTPISEAFTTLAQSCGDTSLKSVYELERNARHILNSTSGAQLRPRHTSTQQAVSRTTGTAPGLVDS